MNGPGSDESGVISCAIRQFRHPLTLYRFRSSQWGIELAEESTRRNNNNNNRRASKIDDADQ
jgi:hypothetical protein